MIKFQADAAVTRAEREDAQRVAKEVLGMLSKIPTQVAFGSSQDVSDYLQYAAEARKAASAVRPDKTKLQFILTRLNSYHQG